MPAVANAVYDAIGVRIDEVPITPEKILKALEAKAAGKAARYGPARFPDIAWPEPLQVPPPWEGGDGKPSISGSQASEAPKLRTASESVSGVMMRLPHFSFSCAADSAGSSGTARGAAASAMLIAGGTDLLPNMKRRQQVPADAGRPSTHRGAASDRQRRRADDRRRRHAQPRSCATRACGAHTPACGRRPRRSRRRISATWARSAATSASTRAATTTTRTTSGGRRSTSA